MRMSERGKANLKRWTEQLQREEAISKKRGLLIFLDDSEKKEVGAVGGTLSVALEQEVGPIIVSSFLFNNISNKETLRRVVDDQNEKSYLRKDIEVFRADRWIVKKINDLLNLLIPVSYLNSLNIDKDKVKKFDSTIISDVELQLGLKVNHMETINYELGIGSVYSSLKEGLWSYFYKSSEEEPVEFATYFVNSLNFIFCEKFDYQSTTIDIPEWFIFINGHGGLLHSVAHLSFEGFKKLLDFLDSKINTKLLVIRSCYAVGVNANRIYGEMESRTQEYFSFPIIIQALNDVASLSYLPLLDMKAFTHDKTVKYITNIDFVSFFRKAKEMGNYSEVIKYITADFVENTPQIKLPGIEWFSVIELDKKIVSIGSTLVKARDFKKPLEVVSFFKKEPEVILLYTDYIPFELVINSSAVKYIISMVSPQVTKEGVRSVFTRINKISSTQTFSDIIYWFEPMVKAHNFTFFCIDEIGNNKDIIIFRTDDDCLMVFYRYADMGWVKKLTKRELIIRPKNIGFDSLNKNSLFEVLYQDLIHQRNEYSKLSEERGQIKGEVTAEQIKTIEEVLAKQLEVQKLIKAYTVSEPEVD